MKSRAALLVLLTLPVLLASLVACGPSEEETADPAAELWTEVETLQADLAEKRDQVVALQSELAALESEGEGEEAEAAAEEPAEGEMAEAEEPRTAEEIQAEIAALKDEIQSMSEDFYAKLVQYINTSGIVEGEPLTPEQEQAFEWKAQEDILIAREYIQKAGDYSRALEIYDNALLTDPDNESLLAAKAEAEELRYMDEERFSQVEKGMSQDEVQAVLGTVKRTNVREYPERDVVGWFYRKENGGAAGVFFKDAGEDEWEVSVVDYDAVKPPGAAGDGDGDSEG